MVNEDEIKKLAYKFWEEEGKPEGKALEHYFRATRMLEERESMIAPSPVIGPPPLSQITSATATTTMLKPRSKPREKKSR